MNAHTKLHIAKLQEWTQRFIDQRASGIGAKQWCADHHLSYYAFTYWKRQVKETVVDQALPDIVPLSLPGTSCRPSVPVAADSAFSANCANRSNHTISDIDTVHLSINDLDMQLCSDISESFLAKLIKAVRYA